MSSDYTAPHWERSALVLVDVQQDFLDGPATIAGTAERVGAMANLANCFRRARRPIVHVVRLYPPGGHDVDPPRRAAVEAGARVVAPDSDGAQIPDRLVPHRLDCDTLLAGRPQRITDDEVIMFKPRWSAFYRTRLDEFLRDRGVDTVVVAGCNLPNCPRATLFDASERDYRAVLATDATSQTTDPRLHDLTLLGVHLFTTVDVDAHLGRGRAEPMNTEELRQSQAPLKERYRVDPTSAIVTLHGDGELTGSDMSCTVQTFSGAVEAGLHPAAGGDGSLACSGDMLLEALVACAGVTLRAVAMSMGIVIRGATARAEGDLDFRGTLGVDRSAPVGFEAIMLRFVLDTDADAKQLDTLQRLTERYCVVAQSLRTPPTIEITARAG